MSRPAGRGRMLSRASAALGGSVTRRRRRRSVDSGASHLRHPRGFLVVRAASDSDWLVSYSTSRPVRVWWDVSYIAARRSSLPHHWLTIQLCTTSSSSSLTLSFPSSSSSSSLSLLVAAKRQWIGATSTAPCSAVPLTHIRYPTVPTISIRLYICLLYTSPSPRD